MQIKDISVQLIDSMGNDDSVANAARVSFAKDASQYTDEQNSKLIRYLAAHKHYSPFNHTFLSFRVTAPIFVGRQLVKHEYLPWNEVSRRYVDDEPSFYFPESYRHKVINVKQGSGHSFGEESNAILAREVYASTVYSLNTYNSLLSSNVCAEQARMVLPQNTMTEWIWSGTLKAFAKMLKLRLDSHAQYETRLIAEQIADIIRPLFPVSLPALLESDIE